MWNLTIVGKSLAEVCVRAATCDHPEQVSKIAATQLPEYRPVGQNLFPITSSLLSIDYHFWHDDTFWTTGMSTKASPLRDDHPGQNVLAKIFTETHRNPLADHDYI